MRSALAASEKKLEEGQTAQATKSAEVQGGGPNGPNVKVVQALSGDGARKSRPCKAR